MENPKKSDPIIIETAGMRILVDHRRGKGGGEGVTFDITVAQTRENGYHRNFAAR